jgi:hypothetical protein
MEIPFTDYYLMMLYLIPTYRVNSPEFDNFNSNQGIKP